MQVLSLTPEQLNQLPPKEREQIVQLVRFSFYPPYIIWLVLIFRVEETVWCAGVKPFAYTTSSCIHTQSDYPSRQELRPADLARMQITSSSFLAVAELLLRPGFPINVMFYRVLCTYYPVLPQVRPLGPPERLMYLRVLSFLFPPLLNEPCDTTGLYWVICSSFSNFD